MKKTTFLLLLGLTMPSLTALAQTAPQLEQGLKSHGVSTELLGLAFFLDQGWKAARPPQFLPKEPPQKSFLLNQAWALLTLRHDEIRANKQMSAILASLSLRYAQGDIPPKALEMIDLDLAGLAPEEKAKGREKIKGLLQYNGMLALGIFGAPSERSRQAARRVHEAEKDPLLRVAYSLTLSLLGDLSTVDQTLRLVQNDDRLVSTTANRTLYILFGRRFRLNPNMALSTRKEAAQEILQWWEAVDKTTLSINRQAAITRKLLPAIHPPPLLHTIRDLLRASAIRDDFADKRGSHTAWRILDQKGEGLLEEIAPFLEDPDEDLDIRGEAIRWYVKIKGPKKSKSLLKKIAKDPNPEITALAKMFLEKE